MDGLKLEKWKNDFCVEAEKLQIAYAAFFRESTLNDSYSIAVNDLENDLILEIDEHLPGEIRERLMKIFLETKPEDSV